MNKRLLSSLMMISLLTGCSLSNSSTVNNSSHASANSSSTASSSKHEHTYSNEWSNNAEKHWHAATCEHDTLKIDEADHTWDAGKVTTNVTCTDAGEMTYTCTVCGYEKAEEINPLNHNYGAPTYEWSSDNTTVTATMVCANDASHIVSETVTATLEVTQAQTCTDVELTTFTATFTNEKFETQVKENVVTKDALNHNYGAPTYTWSEDNSMVTATMVCTHNASHTITETTITSSVVTQQATHELDELSTFTATFENNLFEDQTKENVVTKEKISECVYERYSSDETNHYRQCLYCDNKLEGESHSCTSKEAWAQGRTCDVCEYAMEAEHAMLAEFTFEDGLKNTGVDTGVRGTLISNVTETRYNEVTDDSYLISNKFSGTTVLKASHSSSENSFGIKGLDTGTGDFTISMKYAMSANAENIYNKKDQYLIMGTNTETITGQGPAAPCFAIRLGKDSKTAGYIRSTVKVNGEIKNLYVSNESGYFKTNTLVEYRVIKKGTTVTVHLECPPVEGQAKCSPYTVTFELNSPEDLMITPEQVLGFGCNYGGARPGNYSYVDDIKVWNYAVDFAA